MRLIRPFRRRVPDHDAAAGVVSETKAGSFSMHETVVTLVSANASWWKSRKYRKESAKRLRDLKRAGWRLAGFERLAGRGVDTRRYTTYRLIRRDPT